MSYLYDLKRNQKKIYNHANLHNGKSFNKIRLFPQHKTKLELADEQ